MKIAKLAMLCGVVGVVFSVVCTYLSWYASGIGSEIMSYPLLPGFFITSAFYPDRGHGLGIEALSAYILSNALVWSLIFFGLTLLRLARKARGARL